jgi:multiple sugar transport system permease protein
LGIYNTYLGMIIPLVADAAGVFIMRQFFINIPLEVEESARLDGASAFRTFWSVVLPMARPAVITLTILSFQGSWNELAHFIVSRSDPDLNTLTSGVATLVSGSLGSGNQFPLKMAAALLMTIPVAIVFFIFQRYFVRGASGGAVKG